MRNILSAVAALSLLAASCASGPRRSPQPTPAERMGTLTGQIDDLERRVEELNSNVERFDFENWRDVVPDVRNDAEDLSRILEDLKRDASNLEQELLQAEDPGDYEPADDPR